MRDYGLMRHLEKKEYVMFQWRNFKGQFIADPRDFSNTLYNNVGRMCTTSEGRGMVLHEDFDNGEYLLVVAPIRYTVGGSTMLIEPKAYRWLGLNEVTNLC